MKQSYRSQQILNKVLSLVVLIAFGFNTILWAAPTDGAAGVIAAFSSEVTPQNLIDKIIIPQELGSIQDRFLSGRENARENSPLIVHIQDAHASQEAQGNIHALIDYLNQEYGFSLVLLEGASEELNPASMQVFKKAEQNQKFVQELMRQGDVSGAESFLISNAYKNPQGIKAYGLESQAAYTQDLNQFRAVWPETERGRKFVDQLVQLTDRASSRNVNPELRTFLKEWSHFKEFRQDLNSYFNTIDKAASRYLELDLHDPRNQREWPILLRIFKLKEIEPKLNANQAKMQWEEAKTKLRGFDIDSELLAQIESRLFAREEEMSVRRNSTRGLFESLLNIAHPKGFTFRDYPQLALLVGNSILRYEVDSEQVFNEIERLNTKIIDRLAVTDQEKQVVELLRLSFLLKDLFQLELSRDNYIRLKAGEELFTPEELIDRLKQIEPSTDAPNQAELKSLSNLYFECLKSYEYALNREHAFFDNLKKALRVSKENKAITVAGGFHTFGFTSQLKENQISYLTISPRISSFDDVEREEKVYVNSLLQPTPKSLSGSLRAKPSILVENISLYQKLRKIGAANRYLINPREAFEELNTGALEPSGIRIGPNSGKTHLINTVAVTDETNFERRIPIVGDDRLDMRNVVWTKPAQSESVAIGKALEVKVGRITDLNVNKLAKAGFDVQAPAAKTEQTPAVEKSQPRSVQYRRPNRLTRFLAVAASLILPMFMVSGLVGCGTAAPVALQQVDLSTLKGVNGQPVTVRTWATPGAKVGNPVQTISTDASIPGATQIDVPYSLTQKSAAGVTISNVDPASLQVVGDFGRSLIASAQLVGATGSSAIKIKVTDEKLRRDLANGVDYAQVDKATPVFFFKVGGNIEDLLAAFGKIKQWYPDFQMDGGSLEFSISIEDNTDTVAFVSALLARFNLTLQSPEALINGVVDQFATSLKDIVALVLAGRVLGQELQLNGTGVLRISLRGDNIQHEFNLSPGNGKDLDGQDLVWTAGSLAELPRVRELLPDLTGSSIEGFTFIREDLQRAVKFTHTFADAGNLAFQEWTINLNLIPNVDNRTVIIGVVLPGTVPASWIELNRLFQAFQLENVKRLRVEYKTKTGVNEVGAVAYFYPDPAQPNAWILVKPPEENFKSQGGAPDGWLLPTGETPRISRFFIIPEPMDPVTPGGDVPVMKVKTAYQAIPSPVLFGLSRSELRAEQIIPSAQSRRPGRFVKLIVSAFVAGVLSFACACATQVPQVTPPVIPSASVIPGLADAVGDLYSGTTAQMANLSALSIAAGDRIKLVDSRGSYEISAVPGGSGFTFSAKPGDPPINVDKIKYKFTTTANQVTFAARDIKNHPTDPVTIFRRTVPFTGGIKQVDFSTMLGGELPEGTNANEATIIVPNGTLTMHVDANTVLNKDLLAIIPQPVTPATIITLADHPTENTVDLSQQDIRVSKNNAGSVVFSNGRGVLTFGSSELAGSQNDTTNGSFTFFRPFNQPINLRTLASGNNRLIFKNLSTENVLPELFAADGAGHGMFGTRVVIDTTTANGTADFPLAEFIEVLEENNIDPEDVRSFGIAVTAGGKIARQLTPGGPVVEVPEVANRNAQVIIDTSTNNAQPPDLIIDNFPLPTDPNPSTANMNGARLNFVNATGELTIDPRVILGRPSLPLALGSRTAVSPTGTDATGNNLVDSTLSIQVPPGTTSLFVTIEFQRNNGSNNEVVETATDFSIPVDPSLNVGWVRFSGSTARAALISAGVVNPKVRRVNIQSQAITANTVPDNVTLRAQATGFDNFPDPIIGTPDDIFTNVPNALRVNGAPPNSILSENVTGVGPIITSYNGNVTDVESSVTVDNVPSAPNDWLAGESLTWDLSSGTAAGFSIAIQVGHDIGSTGNLTPVPFYIELVDLDNPSDVIRKIVYSSGGQKPTAGSPTANVFTFSSADIPDPDGRRFRVSVFTDKTLSDLANTGSPINSGNPIVIRFLGNIGVIASSELRAEAAELLDFVGLDAARKLSIVGNAMGIPRSELRVNFSRRTFGQGALAALSGLVFGPSCAIDAFTRAVTPQPITGTPTERILKSAQAYFRYGQLERVPLDRLVPGQTIDTTSPTVIGLYLIYLSLIAAGKVTVDYMSPAAARGEILYLLGKLRKYLDIYGPLGLFSTKFKILTQKDLTSSTELGDLIPVVGKDGQENSLHDNLNLLAALVVMAGNLAADAEVWTQADGLIKRQSAGFGFAVDPNSGLFWGVIDRHDGHSTNQEFKIDRFINESLLGVILARVLNPDAVPQSVLLNLTNQERARVTTPLDLNGDPVSIITDGLGQLPFTNGLPGLLLSGKLFENSVLDIANRNINSALLGLASTLDTGGLPAPANGTDNVFHEFGVGEKYGRNFGDFTPKEGVQDQVHSIYGLVLLLNRLRNASERQKAEELIAKGVNRVAPVIIEGADVQFVGEGFDAATGQSVSSLLGINQGMMLVALLQPLLTDSLQAYLDKSGYRSALEAEIAAIQASQLGGVFIPKITPTPRVRSELRSQMAAEAKILGNFRDLTSLQISDRIAKELEEIANANSVRMGVIFRARKDGIFTSLDSGIIANWERITNSEDVVIDRDKIRLVFSSAIVKSPELDINHFWQVQVEPADNSSDVIIQFEAVRHPIQVSIDKRGELYYLSVEEKDTTDIIESVLIGEVQAFAVDRMRDARNLSNKGFSAVQIREEIKERIEREEDQKLLQDRQKSELRTAENFPSAESRTLVSQLALNLLPLLYASEISESEFRSELREAGYVFPIEAKPTTQLTLSPEISSILEPSAHIASNVKARKVEILPGMLSRSELRLFVRSRSMDLNFTSISNSGYQQVFLVPEASESEVAVLHAELRKELDRISSGMGVITSPNALVVKSVPSNPKAIAQFLVREGYLPGPKSELRGHTVFTAPRGVLEAISYGNVLMVDYDISLTEATLIDAMTVSVAIWDIVSGAVRFDKNRIVRATELISSSLEKVRVALRKILVSA